MTNQEILEFITNKGIDKNDQIQFVILEGDEEVTYFGRFEFTQSGTPAITDESVGIRVIRIKDGPDVPYGKLKASKIIAISLND